MVERRIPVDKELKEQLSEMKAPTQSFTDVIEQLAHQAGVSLEDSVEVDAQAEQMAGEVMLASDLLDHNEGQSKAEYLRRTYDVDPEDYDDVEQLRQAVRGEGPTDE